MRPQINQPEGCSEREKIQYNRRTNRHACPYCLKLTYNIKPHLLLPDHANEPEIKKINLLDESIKEQADAKSHLLLLLAYRGDFLHNEKVLKNQAGQFLLRRRSVVNDTQLDLSTFAPCPICKVYSKLHNLDRHQSTGIGRNVSMGPMNIGYSKSIPKMPQVIPEVSTNIIEKLEGNEET